jgi:hypothetical protein
VQRTTGQPEGMTRARFLAAADTRAIKDLYAALTYNFVTPDVPHRSNPRYDLDLASFSIVKTIWGTPGNPTGHWHWTPKQAFGALARHYHRHAASRGNCPTGSVAYPAAANPRRPASDRGNR